MNRPILSILLGFIALLSLGSCATYYQKNSKFQEYVASGNIDKARKLLDNTPKLQNGRNKLLFHLNSGWVSWMQDQPEASNRDFETADYMMETYKSNVANEALSIISNPALKPYQAEDFEKVMVNYYKSLNYLQLNKMDEALVECRKINIKLNQLNDRYKDHKNRYQRDGFAHLLMGLIYDASGDYNNAFIAYRNALEVYESDYSKNFGLHTPEQLKQDLLRTAYQTGFYEELAEYEKQFGYNYQHQPAEHGQAVVFWQNGLGPVKAEWSINFTKIAGDGGWVTFANEDLDLSFPFYIGDQSDREKSAFAQLSFMRVAFPKYLERPPVFNTANLIADTVIRQLEPVEDVNAIAFKTLHDRMIRDMANSLLRLATKKAIETATRRENQDLGAAIGILNALTEKADTRNWQTLPHTISYARIPLPAGSQTIQLRAQNKQGEQIESSINLDIKEGKTRFFAFQNLESYPPVSGNENR